MNYKPKVLTLKHYLELQGGKNTGLHQQMIKMTAS